MALLDTKGTRDLVAALVELREEINDDMRAIWKVVGL